MHSVWMGEVHAPKHLRYNNTQAAYSKSKASLALQEPKQVARRKNAKVDEMLSVAARGFRERRKYERSMERKWNKQRNAETLEWHLAKTRLVPVV